MDTKSRKSKKIAKVIILLCVLLPAVLLVSLYPTMEKAMLKQREYYETLHPERELIKDVNGVLSDHFINYVVESSYWLYVDVLNETQADKIPYTVLSEYGWDSDYVVFEQNVTFQATYQNETMEEPFVISNTDWIDADVARLTLEFDGNGKVTESKLEGNVVMEDNSILWGNNNITVEEGNQKAIHSDIVDSMAQFRENAKSYNIQYGTELKEQDYIPKNFKIEVGLNLSSDFISEYDYHGYDAWWLYSETSLYAVTGAYWVVAACIVFVILAALLLPFVKRLNTGREKLFSIPFEITCGVGVGAVLCTIGMGILMAHTTMTELNEVVGNGNGFRFLGEPISANTLYLLLRIASVIGWSFTFFLIYIVTANLRQLLSEPKYYLKNQILTVRFFRWIGKKTVKLYDSVTDFDINEKLDKTILKIVGANFVVLTLLCCMWFFGVAGLLVYSIALLILMKKQGLKIQKQYHSVLHATEQMAEGDLKISLEEDLGVFEPIGESLEKVQQGFKKAVVEEAKSQNMKTELITNVSHDLKTPLTAIITYVDLLKKDDISEEERKSYINTLEQKSQRLKVLIEDLFEVSKATSGNVKMNFMDVDVVSLLKQVRSEMSEQIEKSNLSFRWGFPEEKVVLSLDGQKTYRVFENLINNILKYAMPYSRVYIDVAETEKKVQIRFRNVSALELEIETEKLTERFVRGDASRKSEGSGLGLAIAKSFVELQKGSFDIQVDGDLFKVLISFDKELEE